LTDSAAHLADPDTLRARLGVDGYLYFRGLLPAAEVAAAGTAVRTALAAGGWADREGRPTAGAPRALNAREAAADPAYRRAAASASFNRIPYLRPLRSLVRSLLGADAFSYPVKVLRAVYPEAAGDPPPRGRYVHQDYPGIPVNDMFTTWVPLMPIPRRLGGLAVLPGSHLGAAPPVRPLGEGQAESGAWASADYEAGDVLLFHCLTSHAALPNRDGRLRLSQDSRWQSGGQPAPARMIYGPKAESEGEAFNRLFGRQPWWEPVPAGLRLIRPGDAQHEAALSPTAAWSRFFPVGDPAYWAERVRAHRAFEARSPAVRGDSRAG
jgi:hypothetical protein